MVQAHDRFKNLIAQTESLRAIDRNSSHFVRSGNFDDGNTSGYRVVLLLHAEQRA